jgi:hypothetical protein
MQANRIQVKVYARTAAPTERLIPVFHRWIRERVLDELAIDVADYGHVHEGPGVVLIGHSFDYFFEESEGRHGLVYARKRDAPPPAERLADAVRRALAGARRLEQDPTLEGLKFRADELLVRVPDRLNASPDDAGFRALKSELDELAQKLFAGGATTIERVGTARDPLSARVKGSGPASVSDLLARLG